MKNWYALYIRPRTEKKVAKEFQYKNIEYYLPLQKKLRQWSDRKKWVELPVISGYIFIRISPKERLDALKTDFVIGFVRYLQKDAIILEEQMRIMKQVLGQEDYDVKTDFTNYKEGQEIRIISGPLVGISGILIKIKNKKKVLIRINEVDLNMVVEVPGNHLEPLQKRQLVN